jgi:hypothetical protein
MTDIPLNGEVDRRRWLWLGLIGVSMTNGEVLFSWSALWFRCGIISGDARDADYSFIADLRWKRSLPLGAPIPSEGAHHFWRRPVIMASPITSRGPHYFWGTNYFWHNYYFWGRPLLLASPITSRGAHYFWGRPLLLASPITSGAPITVGIVHYF